MRALSLALAFLAFLCSGLAQCVPGNVAGCSGNQAGPSGVIAGSSPSVSVAYNVTYSTGNSNRKADIYYLTSEGLTGKHLHCSAGGPIRTEHGGGGNTGDKQSFAFVGFSDFVLWVEKTGCPVYTFNYTLNVASGAHWIQAWQDVMCGAHAAAHNIGAGIWPGTIDGGFVDVAFSWGNLLNRLTEPGLYAALIAAGYTESCEYNDAFTVRSYSAQADLIDIKTSCQNVPSGGCDPTNNTTLLPVAVADQFNCQTPGDITACISQTGASNGYGVSAGEPITYPTSFPPRSYVGNGASDTLLVPSSNVLEMVAAYAAAGLPPLYYTLETEGGGGHQAGLFLQFAGDTWTKLLLNMQNTGRVANVGGGFKGVFGSF